MTKLTIELPDTMTVAMRNGASVAVNVEALSALGAELFAYGVGQKLRDAASAASTVAKDTSTDVQVVAQGMLDTAYASLVAGEWSHRGDGTGADPRTLVARSIVRRAIKEKLGAKSPEWKAFTGQSDADILAKLDANYESNKEVFDPAIDAEIERRAKASKDKQKLAKSATFNI